MATVKQKIAVQKLVEISRKAKGQKKITIGRILREAGYSEAMAIAPQKVTQSKGFVELLSEYMPDDMVAKVHKDLLNAAKLDSYKMDAKLNDQEITDIIESVGGCKVRKILRFKRDAFVTVYFWSPDGNSRKAAIDMFNKIKGNYAPEKQEHKIIGIEIVNYGDTKQNKATI